MKNIIGKIALVALFVMTSLALTNTSGADQGYEDQNGKIEAAMMDQMKTNQQKAKDLIVDMERIQDAIDLKWGQDPEFSQGRLKAVGFLLTQADEIKTQIDLTIQNSDQSIDDKYNKISALMRQLRSIHKEAEAYLE